MAHRTAPYSTGDVILKSEPWAYTVSFSSASEVCYRCLQKPTSGSLRRCSRCKLAHYCSDDCQRLDWKDRHNPECRIIEAFGAMLSGRNLQVQDNGMFYDEFLMLCKVAVKLKKGEPGDEQGACDLTSTNMVRELLAREAEMPQQGNPELMMLFRITKPFLNLIDKDLCPDFSTYLRLFGKIAVHGRVIQNLHGHVVGLGLYFESSAVLHSCMPNAHAILEGKSLIVKAIRNIARLEDVRISYLENLFTFVECRQRKLLEEHFFLCECPACADQKTLSMRHAVKCKSKQCSAAIPLDDAGNSKCHTCGTNNAKQVRKGQKLVEGLFGRMLDRKDVETGISSDPGKQLSRLGPLAEEAEKLFHPCNFLLGILHKAVSEAYKSMDNEDESMQYLMKAVVPMRIHLSKFHGEYSRYLVEIFNWMNKQGGFDILPVAKELESIYAVIPGKDSELYKNHCATFLQ